MKSRSTFALLTLLFGISLHFATAQVLPPCEKRPAHLDTPAAKYCLEQVINDDSAGELSFTALAVEETGGLYATRPLTGEVFAFSDTNQDLLPDTPVLIAEGLTLPNALAIYEDMLYIAGGTNLYRWQAETGLETLASDLPVGTGGWTGGIAIRADSRIYVGVGSENMIYSFALDGSDRQILATGFSQPNGFAWYDGALWVTDTETVTQITEDGETLTPFGLTFPTASTPISLAPYQGSAFPDLAGTLLVALAGNYNESRARGYELVAVHLDQEPPVIETLAPILDNPVEQFLGKGFFPHHLYSVAVSPEGWIYFSTGGGKIFALRPS